MLLKSSLSQIVAYNFFEFTYVLFSTRIFFFLAMSVSNVPIGKESKNSFILYLQGVETTTINGGAKTSILHRNSMSSR